MCDRVMGAQDSNRVSTWSVAEPAAHNPRLQQLHDRVCPSPAHNTATTHQDLRQLQRGGHQRLIDGNALARAVRCCAQRAARLQRGR
jgi:hypothetical protein